MLYCYFSLLTSTHPPLSLPSRLILPLAQSYVLAGYFSVWKKLLRAVIENAVFYATLLVIVVILLVYVVVIEKFLAL